MEILKETRFIERLQFFNGQRLFASDLQGLEAFNREMRWLHNKSLHQPGIGNGFAVSGKKGEREVTIGAGYAIDALGREIVLLESQVEPIPPVAGESDGSPALYYLTVSYPDDGDLEETELREGICNTRGAIRLREQPVFCWVRLNADGQPTDTSEVLQQSSIVRRIDEAIDRPGVDVSGLGPSRAIRREDQRTVRRDAPLVSIAEPHNASSSAIICFKGPWGRTGQITSGFERAIAAEKPEPESARKEVLMYSCLIARSPSETDSSMFCSARPSLPAGLKSSSRMLV